MCLQAPFSQCSRALCSTHVLLKTLLQQAVQLSILHNSHARAHLRDADGLCQCSSVSRCDQVESRALAH